MKTRFRFGHWLVDPSSNFIENADGKRHMEPRTMDVLVALCKANGNIVSAEELLEQCWGSTIHSDGPVHKNVALLRRLLGDSTSAPTFIETVRKRGYRTVAALDFSHDSPATATSWAAGSPFRGLLAFDEAHADVFYGREEVTRKLAEAAVAQAGTGLALVLLLGPSGSGKTSLVQAGLFPALSRVRAAYGTALLATTSFDLADQGEQTLFTALAGALLDLQWEEHWVFAGENAVSLGLRLQHDCDTVLAQLDDQLRTGSCTRPPAPATPTLGFRFGIFIDRFEALFNVNRITEPQRIAFLATLEQLARGGTCLLILACRNDFYPSIARYPLLTAGKSHGGHFDLAAPSFTDISQMIRKPAAAAGLSYGVDPLTNAGLDDLLCVTAANSPDALPLLQYCLQELYRLRTDEGELGFDAFHQLGELEGAIGQRAEQIVVGLTEPQRDSLPHIMSLVTVLSLDEENVTSQRAPWSALRSEEARQTVSALIEARLFVSDLAGSTPVFGIAHDAILRRWPRMTGWIATHRNALRARGRLAQQAGRWAGEGRPADLLLARGKLLDEAKELQKAGLWTLADHERELITNSDRRARQLDRLRLFALALIVLLAMLASGLGVSAGLAKRSADLRRAEAEGLVDFMLGDFADKLRPLGRLDLLESVSGKALEYLGGSYGEDLSPAALTLRAKGLQVIGEVSRSRGDSGQAIDALSKADAILMRQHEMSPRDIQVIKNLGTNAYWIGQMHKDRNDLQQAASAWRRYQQFADLLHKQEPDNVEWWVEQSYAHNNLGSLAHARGAPQLAVPEFTASIALKEKALERMRDSKMVIAELADSYSWLASARQSLGELAQAAQLYEKEIQLVLKLRERFPAEPMWINRQVRALQHRALIELALGKDEHALRDFGEARKLFAQVAQQDPTNRAWQLDLANLEQDELKVMELAGKTQDTLQKLIPVYRTLQSISHLDPKNAAWARSAAVSRSRMAAALLRAGNTQAAKMEINAALAPLEALYADNPMDQNIRITLVESLLIAATIQQAEKDIQNSMMTCKKAYGMIKEDVASTLNFKVLDPWVRVNYCLQNRRAVDIQLNRLKQIGYRDTAYTQFLSTR
jgi:DNA-binding winged helix-turn-helix (wHTH) protein/tetratricopeptide (TPR) repeat protein